MTKKTIIHKKIKTPYKDDIYPIYLELTIEDVDLSDEKIYDKDKNLIRTGRHKQTIDHKRIQKYKTVSISGHSKNMGGQIYDYFEGTEDKRIQRIVKLWKRWHLNDMRPNCIHQTAFDCNKGNFTELAKIETEKCPKGYAYGSEWLVEIVPDEVIMELIILFEGW